MTPEEALNKSFALCEIAASLLEPGEEHLNPEYLRGMEDIILLACRITGELRPVIHTEIMERLALH